MQRLTIGELVFVGFCHLRNIFGTYKQFISVLWNDFFIGNVHKSFWNSTLEDECHLLKDFSCGSIDMKHI